MEISAGVEPGFPELSDSVPISVVQCGPYTTKTETMYIMILDTKMDMLNTNISNTFHCMVEIWLRLSMNQSIKRQQAFVHFKMFLLLF